ncbi:MAG: Hpt domain-containing protein [Defluviitaleaceae bacterium]|nr:Hpt domain-containing protein [Defluviitaleaceae bacterium]
MEYSEYLPHINVAEGKTRVMNNLKLYTSLLGRFKGRDMTNDLLASIKDGDKIKAAQHAHALRGTAANLGFTVLYGITEEIETLCKKDEDCKHLCDALDAAMTALDDAIMAFSATQN